MGAKLRSATSVAELVGDRRALALAVIGVTEIEHLVNMFRFWDEDVVVLVLGRAGLKGFEIIDTKETTARECCRCMLRPKLTVSHRLD